jgi:hypothetical protein
MNYLPRLASNLNPPDLYILSSCDYRHESQVPGQEAAFDQTAVAMKVAVMLFEQFFREG